MLVGVHTFALESTNIAPAFYGPNALPVPWMMDGRVDSTLCVDVHADGFFSSSHGRTVDMAFRVDVPLFTRFAGLSVWMPVQEWYDWPETGHGTGDVYVSTNIQLLSRHFRCFSGTDAERYIPDIALRVGLKTASGEQSQLFRHFDDPGYWFDVSAGYSLCYHDLEFHLGATMGFLCWQTTTARQNDALYYGLSAQLRHRYVGMSVSWQGYSGWETGDKPMVVGARLCGYAKGFEPFVSYQYGLRDYPYHQVTLGLKYTLDILNSRKK